MRKWCDWTRNDIIISCVDEWLMSMSSSSSSIGGGGGDDTTSKAEVVFELPHRAVQTLAALSVISDQYQLYANDDDDSNNDDVRNEEEEWKSWFDNVKTCWMDWISCVNERYYNTTINRDNMKQ